jgi:hypothetical protein
MTQSEQPTMSLSVALGQVLVTAGQAAEIMQALAWNLSDPELVATLRAAAANVQVPGDTPLKAPARAKGDD